MRRNVRYKGKVAAFSSITDSFITKFMSDRRFQRWRRKKYGIEAGPIENSIFVPIGEAAIWARMNRNHEDAVAVLQEAGIKRKEAEALISEAERQENFDEDEG